MASTRDPRRSRTAFGRFHSLETLEGRRLMAAGPRHIRVQEAIVNGVAQLVVQGTRRADVINISDNGTSAAGNVTVTLGNGATYTSQRAVTDIVVRGAQGKDKVTYNLTGELTGTRSAVIALGGGADEFEGNITGDINTSDALSLQVFGEGGGDRLAITQTGATRRGVFFPYMEGNAGNDVLTFKSTGDVLSGATLGPALLGGAGNDWLTADYAGVINGQYLYNNTIDGGQGNDNIANLIQVGAGSWGKIGDSTTTKGIVNGGDGDDHILYAVAINTTGTVLSVNAAIIGGAGNDLVRRTENVSIDKTVEGDEVLSIGAESTV